MNDFTKEELIYILEISEKHEPFNMTTHKLFHNKIQSMLDNYCEHEWDNYYQGPLNTGIYCNKCLKKLRGS